MTNNIKTDIVKRFAIINILARQRNMIVIMDSNNTKVKLEKIELVDKNRIVGHYRDAINTLYVGADGYIHMCAER